MVLEELIYKLYEVRSLDVRLKFISNMKFISNNMFSETGKWFQNQSLLFYFFFFFSVDAM